MRGRRRLKLNRQDQLARPRRLERRVGRVGLQRGHRLDAAGAPRRDARGRSSTASCAIASAPRRSPRISPATRTTRSATTTTGQVRRHDRHRRCSRPSRARRRRRRARPRPRQGAGDGAAAQRSHPRLQRHVPGRADRRHLDAGSERQDPPARGALLARSDRSPLYESNPFDPIPSRRAAPPGTRPARWGASSSALADSDAARGAMAEHLGAAGLPALPGRPRRDPACARVPGAAQSHEGAAQGARPGGLRRAGAAAAARR